MNNYTYETFNKELQYKSATPITPIKAKMPGQ